MSEFEAIGQLAVKYDMRWGKGRWSPWGCCNVLGRRGQFCRDPVRRLALCSCGACVLPISPRPQRARCFAGGRQRTGGDGRPMTQEGSCLAGGELGGAVAGELDGHSFGAEKRLKAGNKAF